MARPELIERRPTWPRPVTLEPLPAEDAEELLPDTFDHELRARIARAAGGNPLFLTEMAAMASEADGEVLVPASLRALLAARLDQLEPRERSVLERGSVEGEIFHRGAVQALTSDGHVTPRLAALVRKGLIRPDKAQLPGEDAFRFHHLLLRDAAYDALPKSVRADLHEHFADWLEQHGAELVELDELLGYHLEQAARYLGELGQDNREISLAAGERLAAAGGRAYWRGDWRTAAVLLERALSLTRPHRLDIRLEVELADALYWTDPARAVAVADAAAGRVTAAGDEADAALARTVAALARMRYGQCSADEVERLAREALPLLETAQHEDGLAHVWYALAWVANMRQRLEGLAQAMEAALRHARRAGHPVPGVFTLALAVALAFGPRPANEALATLDAAIADQPYAGALLMRALLLAMLDRFDEAWLVALPAGERLRELSFATGGAWLADIALLAGDYEAAASHLRDACDALEAIGNTGELSSYAPMLGRVLCRLGRYDEAELLAQRGRELGDPEDVSTQQAWRQTQALVRSARGQHAEAERLSREAVDFSHRSDSPLTQGDALRDLASVLIAAGKRDEAARRAPAGTRALRAQAQPARRRTRARTAPAARGRFAPAAKAGSHVAGVGLRTRHQRQSIETISTGSDDALERDGPRLRCRVLGGGSDSGLARDDLPALGQGCNPRRLVDALAAEVSLHLRRFGCVQPDPHLRREPVLLGGGRRAGAGSRLHTRARRRGCRSTTKNPSPVVTTSSPLCEAKDDAQRLVVPRAGAPATPRRPWHRRGSST